MEKTKTAESYDVGDYTPLSPLTTTPDAKDTTLLEHHTTLLEHERPQSRQRARRLGKTHVTILSLGSLILLLALTALGLLWKESTIAITGAEPREPWVRWLSGNWAPTVVTVSSAFIRTAIAFQGSLATAMLAAIILETIGVPFFLAPLYSVLRAVEVAPMNLLSPIIFRSKG